MDASGGHVVRRRRLRLPVERYEIVDRDSGDGRVIHLAGDVVLDAPSLELTELDTPLVVTTSRARDLSERHDAIGA